MKTIVIASFLLLGGILFMPLNQVHAIESSSNLSAQVDPILTFSLKNTELQVDYISLFDSINDGVDTIQNLTIATNESYGYGMTVKYLEKDILKSVYPLEVAFDNRPKSETINVGIPNQIFESPATIVYSLMPGY